MKNTILVPIDFSTQSMIALEQSYNLAKLSNSSLTLLNVIKTTSGVWGIFSDNEKKDFEFKIEQKLKSVAAEVEKKVNIEVGIIIRRGKVVEEIMRVSDYLKPKLILMGTSPGTQISRKIIGSRALDIIKSSKYPIISIKGKTHSNTCENILLPIDATKHTTRKVELAIDMAKLFNSKITILTAIEKSKKDRISLVETKLKQIKQKIEDHNLECDSSLLHTDNDRGNMALSILGYAHRVNADLIVIMTQQEGGLVDFFLGSLATSIIFTSDIPVLSVNPSYKQS